MDFKEFSTEELKEIKIIIDTILKERKPKKTKSREDKIKEVESKLNNEQYSFNYHELMYAFEIICRKNNYNITVNIKDETPFIKRAFGDKPKTGFGKTEIDIITRYITSYDRLYRTEIYPYPTLKGLSLAWVITKIKSLVTLDNKGTMSQLSKEVF